MIPPIHSVRPWLAACAWLTVAGCGGTQRELASRPPDQFCRAIVAGDLAAASGSAHAALVAAGAASQQDASQPLAAWLRQQPCVQSVTVPTTVVETMPGIREIAITLHRDAAGASRTCSVDLRLAAGAMVNVHPASWNSEDRDTHCTATVRPTL